MLKVMQENFMKSHKTCTFKFAKINLYPSTNHGKFEKNVCNMTAKLMLP